MRSLYTIVGIFVTLIALVCGCEQEKPVRSSTGLKPWASFEVTPVSGRPETTFSVDAASSFSKTGTELVFRWDWEDDGVWDTDLSAETSATHVYDSLGYRTIKLEVEDEEGMSATATREILVTVASKEMMLVPAGEFIMGSPEGVGNDDEHPQHQVYLDDFLIGKYEVTNNQYVEFLNAIGRNDDGNGHEFVNINIAPIRFRNEVYKVLKGWDNHPVVAVSWYGAKAYAEWEGGRLPTEAEWEKAARGTDGHEWPWGNFWELGRCNSLESGLFGTAAVGSFPTGISPYGVHDMTGNVYEWIADWYQDDYYAISPAQNPKGPDQGVFRVVRGGSCAEISGKCRPAVRFGQGPDEGGDSDFGFRIAKDVEN
jgi:formylglycine-generating enzyme required for sulfatase activity